MQIMFEYSVKRGLIQLSQQVHTVEVGDFPTGRDYPSPQQLLAAELDFMRWFSETEPYAYLIEYTCGPVDPASASFVRFSHYRAYLPAT